MMSIIFRALLALPVILSIASYNAEQSKASALYKEPNQTIDARVEDLLSRMTIQDKTDQVYQSVESDFNPNNVQSTNTVKYKSTFGSYIYFPNSSGTRIRSRNEIQKMAIEQSPLGIPAIFGSDVIHGCFLIFPIPLAQACSWNPELVRRSCSFSASEARRAGVDWVFSPMIDVCFDSRWGRIAEGYGESPYATSVFAASAVKGYQGESLYSKDTVACTLKHFIGYGASEGGRDYTYTDISPVRLWEMYLPPYQAGVKAGAASIMSSFNDLNGVPMTANHYLLTDVLRKLWDFKGVVVTDWGAVSKLVGQGYAADESAAMKMAMNAGIDMNMYSHEALQALPALVASGEVSKDRLDEAVRRILRMKFSLGLFEHPYADNSKVSPERLAEGNKIAEDLAAQSLVLLKNEGDTLPISSTTRQVALIGPLGSNKSDPLGCWRSAGDTNETVTIEEGLRSLLPANVRLKVQQGCRLEGDKREGFAAAVELAKQSDIIILCLGEPANATGENSSSALRRIPAVQEELALELAKTLKPIVLVLSTGRPVELTRLEPTMKAILEIWKPGTKTGTAVAKVLTGEINPSGRLAVTWPKSSAQIPIYHNMHPRANPSQGSYKDFPSEPQYEFGYGLSYSKFSYGPIALSAPSVKEGGELTAEVTVTNSGKKDGEETVFWYVNHPAASITQPIKEMKFFEKASIPAGGSHLFRFVINPGRDLSFLSGSGDPILESGTINLLAGDQRASFHLDK